MNYQDHEDAWKTRTVSRNDNSDLINSLVKATKFMQRSDVSAAMILEHSQNQFSQSFAPKSPIDNVDSLPTLGKSMAQSSGASQLKFAQVLNVDS